MKPSTGQVKGTDSDAVWNISSPLHNKVALEDRPIHGWYRFVLSFPPHLVRSYLETLGADEGGLVLDPFCGTGTTPVEAKKLGLPSIGCEANPMARFASAVKTSWTIDPDDLLTSAATVLSLARDRPQPMPLGPLRLGAEGVMEQPSLFGLLSLNEAEHSLLLAGSISPLPLHRCLALREAIMAAPGQHRDHMLLALAWTAVNAAGNLRFGPEVGITAPKADADVESTWFNQVSRMAEDLRLVQAQSQTACQVIDGDARNGEFRAEPNSVTCVFTSPPYPNEKDYTRTTRLESVLLGMIKSKSDLRALKRRLLRSNTRTVYVDDADDFHVTDIAEISQLAEEVEARRLKLGKTSGFEKLYHRVVSLYFGGMARHLDSIKPFLKRGAMLGYVVGDQASFFQIMIRTGTLLAKVAERQGYEVVGIDLFRTRYATATREQLREEVVILRWPGE